MQNQSLVITITNNASMSCGIKGFCEVYIIISYNFICIFFVLSLCVRKKNYDKKKTYLLAIELTSPLKLVGVPPIL